MKAEASSAAARAHSRSLDHGGGGSVLGEATATAAAKAHVRALLDRAQSVTRPPPPATTNPREAEHERPRWRSTAPDALYEPKREPTHALFNGYNATANERSHHHHHYAPHESGHGEYGDRNMRGYDTEHARHYAYEAPPHAPEWGSEPPYTYHAAPVVLTLHSRRSSNNSSSSAALTPTPDDNDIDDNDLDDDDGRVVVHLQEPRSSAPHRQLPHRQLPHTLKTRRQASNSSYRSASNSSLHSVASLNGQHDDAYAERAVYADASEADDDDAVDLSTGGRLSVSDDLQADVYEDNELHSDFPHMLHMLIPSNAFGCLVGSHGAIIRWINARTGCTLSIRDGAAFALSDDDDGGGDDAPRVLRIYGKPKGICLAQHLVIDRIRAHRFKKQDPLYTPLTLRGGSDVLVPLATDTVSKALIDSLTPRKSKRDAMTAPSSSSSTTAATASSSTQETGATFGSVKWLVPSENVGKIMGSDGTVMRGIARASNTKIHVTPTADMPRGSAERLVTIAGPPSANFEFARAEIERLAGGRAEAQARDSKDSQYFAIPFHTAGALIGPQGKIARAIRDQTGVQLQIPHSEYLPVGSVNRILHLQGTRQQVEHAYTVVRARLRRELERLAIENNDDDDDDDDTGDSRAVPPITHLALKILLPVHIAHLMLGQQGRLVHEVSAKSGAHIHFLPSHSEDLRICLISSTLAAVLRAQRLILQLVAGDLIATKRSALGADSGVLPRGKRKRDGDDDAADRGGRPATAAAAVTVGVRRGGRPNERNDGRRGGGAPSRDTRRLQLSAAKPPPTGGRGAQRLPSGGSARAPEEKLDIMDRLQGPLQAARSTGSGSNKRQRN
ncbi:hypothetical protein PybrP1_008493 [[Pythium] brassicae (nom. inval.)]|nr:hypothetical protein PybrP1_008493 [[Pythium] brassicae (nom. inval.)]